MKRSQEIAQNLIDYFNSARQVGHTTAAVNGIRSTHLGVLIAPWNRQAQDIRLRTGVETISLGDVPNKLRGKKVPVLLDNTAVSEFCCMVNSDIISLEKDAESLRAKNKELTDEIKRLKGIIAFGVDTQDHNKLRLENKLVKNEKDFLKETIKSIQNACKVALED